MTWPEGIKKEKRVGRTFGFQIMKAFVFLKRYQYNIKQKIYNPPQVPNFCSQKNQLAFQSGTYIINNISQTNHFCLIVSFSILDSYISIIEIIEDFNDVCKTGIFF